MGSIDVRLTESPCNGSDDPFYLSWSRSKTILQSLINNEIKSAFNTRFLLGWKLSPVVFYR